MPLQNRVTPDMQLVAEHWRGMFMGNRGGRIHDPVSKTLLHRKWASKRWIICVTQFKNRQREVMGAGYTELFFMDEVSALAAGHRPCFECRRQDAKLFAELWQQAHGKINGSVADQMDHILHKERTSCHLNLSAEEIHALPDGTMIRCDNTLLARHEGTFRAWSGNGYGDKIATPEYTTLLTPPAIVGVLKNGYKPAWHPSAVCGNE